MISLRVFFTPFINDFSINGCSKKRGFSWLSKKVSSALARLFGVKEKVLGIDSEKILRPDTGLYSQYFPSYDIFCETQIFIHPILNLVLRKKKEFCYHKKWHNSESIVSTGTDLGQVSKFSLFFAQKVSSREKDSKEMMKNCRVIKTIKVAVV